MERKVTTYLERLLTELGSMEHNRDHTAMVMKLGVRADLIYEGWLLLRPWQHGDSFMDRLVRGDESVDDIDDHIEAWHDEPLEADGSSRGIPDFANNVPLYVWLGMTSDEYVRWVGDPSTLNAIVSERRKQETSLNALTYSNKKKTL